MTGRVANQRRTLTAIITALAGSGCAVFGTADPERGTLPCCGPAAPGSLELQYLGSGGWMMAYDGIELLTAPFFSNPTIKELAGRFEPKTQVIDQGLPPVGNVSAVLVGHAHYDHLMDVPYILTQRARSAHVYGSATTANVLAAVPGLSRSRVHNVEGAAGTAEAMGQWITPPGGRIRFMPLRADHAPHFQGIELYEGEVTEPLRILPSSASDWVGGATLAYLIDFLAPDGTVAFRVHYQDAGSSWPGGVPPRFGGGDDHPVDVAILCAPSYGEVQAYPEGVLHALRPRVALVGHWESFFTDWTRTPSRSVMGTNLGAFTKRLERSLPVGARWSLPNPGDVIIVPSATP